MAISKFQRNFNRKSTYNCRICNRLTRDVGDNGGVELCEQCNTLAMIENAWSDGHKINQKDVDEAQRCVRDLQAKKAKQSAIDDWTGLIADLERARDGQ